LGQDIPLPAPNAAKAEPWIRGHAGARVCGATVQGGASRDLEHVALGSSRRRENYGHAPQRLSAIGEQTDGIVHRQENMLPVANMTVVK
jgi:hypothetical protein